MQTLPWAKPFRRRCRARIDPGADSSSGLYGRCELAPHTPEVEHALERGMVTVRWSSLVRWDGSDWAPEPPKRRSVKGGYQSSARTVDDLRPPPAGPGAGSR